MHLKFLYPRFNKSSQICIVLYLLNTVLLNGASCRQNIMNRPFRIGYLAKLAFLSLWIAIPFTIKSL